MRQFCCCHCSPLCWPAAAASPRQTVTFEAPRELLSASTREATLDQIASFGVTDVRQLVYWRDYAPEPDSRRGRASTRRDPAAYGADKWDNLDGLIAAAKAQGVAVTLTITGPVPRWVTRRRTTSPTRTRRSTARSRPRSAAATATRSARGRSGTSPTSRSSSSRSTRTGKPYSPKLYRKLYQAAYAGLRSTAANADDTILIGETSPRGNSERRAPARVPARDAVPGLQVPQGEVLRRSWRPTATRTTRTRPAPGRASSPRTPTTSRSACSRG